MDLAMSSHIPGETENVGEFLHQLLEEDIDSNFEPVKGGRSSKRSSILKMPKNLDMEFCNTEECETQRRSQTMKRRVSFADTFQVMELHTGNIYDVPGNNDDSNCQILLQQEHDQNADVNASNEADQSISHNVSRKHKMTDTDEPIAKKKTNLFLSSTASKNIKKTLNFGRKKKNISDSNEKENIIPDRFEIKESDDMELTIFPSSSDVNTIFLDDDIVFQDEKNVHSDVTDKTCHFVSEVMELTCNSEYPLKQIYSDTFEDVPGKFFVNSSTAHSSTAKMPKDDWQSLEKTFLKSSSKNVSTSLNSNLCHQVMNTSKMFTIGTGSHNELKNKNTDIYSNKENFKPFSFAPKCDLKYLTISKQEYFKRMDRNATLNLEHISAFKLSNLDSNQTEIPHNIKKNENTFHLKENDKNTDYLESDLMELTCNFKNSLEESSVMYDSVENIASESPSINMEITCASASPLCKPAEEHLHDSFNQTAKNMDLSKTSLDSSNQINVICNIEDKYVSLNPSKGFLFEGKSCIDSKKSFGRMVTKESPIFEPHISRTDNQMQSQENENELVKNPAVMSHLKATNSSTLSLNTTTDEIQQSSKIFSYDINDKNTHYFTSNMMDLTHNTEVSFKQSPTGIQDYLKNIISPNSLQSSKHLCAGSNFTGSPVQEFQKTGIESFRSNLNLSTRNVNWKSMINNSELYSQIQFAPVYDIRTQPTAVNSNKKIFDLDANISTELKKTADHVSLKRQSDSVPDISEVSMRCSIKSKGNEQADMNGSMVSDSKFVKLLGIDNDHNHISNTEEKIDISVHVNNFDKNTLCFTSNPMELTCNSENSVEEVFPCHDNLEAINSKESFNVTKEQNKHLSINPNKAMLFCNSNNSKLVKCSDINIQNETLKTDLDSQSKCHKKQSYETTNTMPNIKLLPADTSFNASNKSTQYFSSEFVDLTCNFKNISEHSAVNHCDNTQDSTSSRKSYVSNILKPDMKSSLNFHPRQSDVTINVIPNYRLQTHDHRVALDASVEQAKCSTECQIQVSQPFNFGIVDKNTRYFSSDPMAMTCNFENLAEYLDASEYSIQNISSEKRSNKSICLSHNSFSNLPVAETRRVSLNRRVSLKDCSDFISKHMESKSESGIQNYNLNGQISNTQCMEQSNQPKISDEKLEYVENSVAVIKNSDVKISEENSFQQLSNCYDNFKNVALSTDSFILEKAVTPVAKNYSEEFQIFATHSRHKRSHSPCNKNMKILKSEVSCNCFEESGNSIDLCAGSSLSGTLVPEIPEREKYTKRIIYTFAQNENNKSMTINENSKRYETQLDEVFNLKDNNWIMHSNNKIFQNNSEFTEVCGTILKEKSKTASDLTPLQHEQPGIINANAIHDLKNAEIPDRLALDVAVHGHEISLSLGTMNEVVAAEEYRSNYIRDISKTSISNISNNQVLYKGKKQIYNLPLCIRFKRDSIQKEIFSDDNLSTSSNTPNLIKLESRFLKPINPLKTGILYTIKKMKNYPDIKKKISDVCYFPENVFSGKKELRLKLPNSPLEARTSNLKSESFQFQDQSLVKRKSLAIFSECTSHSSQGSTHVSKETSNGDTKVESHITCIKADAYKSDSEIHKQCEVASYSNTVEKSEQCLSNNSALHSGKVRSVPSIELPTSYEFSTTLKNDSKTFQAADSFANKYEDSLELLPDSILESSVSVNTFYSRKTEVSTYDENSVLIKRTVASEDHLEMSAKKIVSASQISTVNSNLLENSKFLMSSDTSYKHPTNELSKFLHITPCAKAADIPANISNLIIKKRLSFVECDLNDSKLQSITKHNFSPIRSSMHAVCSESELLNMRTNERNIGMTCTHLVPKVKNLDVLNSVNAVSDVSATLSTDMKSSIATKNDSKQEDFPLKTIPTKFSILLTRSSTGTISSESELLNTESQANIGKTGSQLASEAKNFELHNSVNTVSDVIVVPITCANEVNLNRSSSELQNLQLLSTKHTFSPTKPSANTVCSGSEVPDIEISQPHIGMTCNQFASEAQNFKLCNSSNAIPDDTVDPTSDIDCVFPSRNGSELNMEVSDAKIEISGSQFVSEVRKYDTHESNYTVPEVKVALAADVGSLTKNPNVQRSFRTSIVPLIESSDAEISCLIKETSSIFCNETNLQGNKIEVKWNSSSCINHNEENEQNQQKNKPELREESNSCASSNEGSYIDEEKGTTLTKKSVENQSLESVDRMKCKLTQFPLAGKRYWVLTALDEKQAMFHLTWGHWLYKCQLLIQIPCEQSVSNGFQISFQRLDSGCRVRNLGHELFLCQKKSTSILPPVNSEKILKLLEEYSNIISTAEALMLDISHVSVKHPYDCNFQETVTLTVEVLNRSRKSAFSLRFPINMQLYPNERIIPQVNHVSGRNIKEEIILQALMKVEPGKNYLWNMVKAAEIV